MPKGKTLQVVFKGDHQRQLSAFPLDLETMIDADDPVRLINTVIDKVDISDLLRMYKPGGTSSYHPRILLKAIVYAYINNIYSTRKIEQVLSHHIHYMWLTGLSRPDHNTIHRFRSQRLQAYIKPIFTRIVLLLHEAGLLDIEDLYTDGTRIEASASRFSFVWKKSLQTNRDKISKKLDELWQYAQSVAAKELEQVEPASFNKIDSSTVTQTIEAINTALKGKPGVPANITKSLQHAKRKWPAALDRYAKQEAIIGEQRSSCSKTDTDATFMRSKEQSMSRAGILKPHYNLQLSTNQQFIVAYSVHQVAGDSTTLPEHLGSYIKEYGRSPESVTADAGYGSEQNYQWLEDKGITGYVKHSQFNKEKKAKAAQPEVVVDRSSYDKAADQYVCPAGHAMPKIRTTSRVTSTGYPQTIDIYGTTKCAGCPLQQQCNPDRTEKMMDVNHNLQRLRYKAEALLISETGKQKSIQRSCDVEAVFGNIKNNHHFRRFMLRGIKKVSVEVGLLAIAQNLRKLVS